MAGPDSSAREKRLLQGMIHTWQQELDKEREAMRDEDIQREENLKGNRYLLEEQGAPRMEMAVTIRLLEGKRTAPVTGSRSCLPIARGMGDGLQRVARDYLDTHTEGRTREGKNAPKGGQEGPGGGRGMGPLPAGGGLEGPRDSLILERGTGRSS